MYICDVCEERRSIYALHAYWMHAMSGYCHHHHERHQRQLIKQSSVYRGAGGGAREPIAAGSMEGYGMPGRGCCCCCCCWPATVGFVFDDAGFAQFRLSRCPATLMPCTASSLAMQRSADTRSTKLAKAHRFVAMTRTLFTSPCISSAAAMSRSMTAPDTVASSAEGRPPMKSVVMDVSAGGCFGPAAALAFAARLSI